MNLTTNETLNVATTANSVLTSATYTKNLPGGGTQRAHYAEITCRSGKINFAFNSVDLSSTGHTLGVDQMVVTDDLEDFVCRASTTAVLYVTYYWQQPFTATS